MLTSLAQLASLRLHAQRALISLIDDQSQIILAEATTTTPLHHSPSDDLWLGSAIIPRACGVCECALEPAAFVVNDLQHDDHFATRSFVRAPPALRFYAGVPLKSLSGCTIGVLCISDDAPRQGLDPAQLLLMQDLAAVIVSYLATSRGHEANRKAEQMVRGLTSFVTGAADLQQASELDVPCASDNDLHSRTSQKEEETTREEECLVSQDQLFPPLVTRMFARAANIMRESCQLDGVIFFDLSAVNEASSNEIPSISPTPESHSAGPFISSTSDDEFSDDDHSPSFSQECRPTCKIIGFADASRSTLHGSSPRRGYLRLTEKSLKGLLKSHSQGIVFDVSETNADNGSVEFAQEGEVRGRTTVNAIVDVANDACSAAIIPLWDYERERWLAGCLCWVSDPNRALTYGSDLLYYRAFGHSILAEMSRINSIAVEQAKAKSIESMSHELRSPLHGILGGVEYLQSMKLDVFQTDIVNSIATCGRTLLDTISNVLEYSKINDFTGPYAQPNRAALRHTSAVRNDMDPAVDIRHLTEETIEAVSAGQSYDINTAQFCSGENGLFNSPPTPGAEGPIRKNVRLILDLSNRSYWTFAVQPGIWRRIVMNVFGNALRFTDFGFVKVSLSAKDISDGSSEIVLTVADSGVGMSADFVQHDLFKPFSQKSSFTSGTGLGMNIVQRLVHSLGGELSVQSEVNVGTVIKISLRLHKCNKLKDDFESSIATQANGRQVVIVRELIPESAETFELSRQSEQDFHSSLADTLQAWFGIDVTTSHKVSSENAQLIIYPGPTFEEGFIKRSRKGISVVIALDGIEAATLRADPRVRSGRVEVVTQP